MRVILTIAGSDSGAGAGIQADLKTIAAHGAYGGSVLTAVTAQNTYGVAATEPVSANLIRAQIAAIFADFDVVAVKSGMLGTAEAVSAVADALRQHRPPHYVLDPVLVATSGYFLLAPRATPALLRDLLPLATLVTPNASEAEALTGMRVATPREAEAAGRRLLEMGVHAVLVTGGHLQEQPATDVLVAAEGVRSFPGEFIDSPHTHGVGCTYASAIATQLGHGLSLTDAIVLAKAYVTEAIRHGLALGGGQGPLDHFFFLRRRDAFERWVGCLPRMETPV